MTVDKIAWIVGLKLGTMHESQDAWIKKIIGPLRIRRIYHARAVTMLVLHEECGVSYLELSHTFGGRYVSAISRSLVIARKWAEENHELWASIVRAVRESTDAEQQAHAKAGNFKVGFEG